MSFIFNSLSALSASIDTTTAHLARRQRQPPSRRQRPALAHRRPSLAPTSSGNHGPLTTLRNPYSAVQALFLSIPTFGIPTWRLSFFVLAIVSMQLTLRDLFLHPPSLSHLQEGDSRTTFPIPWRSILFIFMSTFSTHAATLRLRPGEDPDLLSPRVLLGLAFPWASMATSLEGVVRGLRSRVRKGGAVQECTKSQVEQEVRDARMGGALCTIVRTRGWEPVNGMVLPGVEIVGDIKHKRGLDEDDAESEPFKLEVSGGANLHYVDDERVLAGTKLRAKDLENSGYRIALLPDNVEVEINPAWLCDEYRAMLCNEEDEVETEKEDSISPEDMEKILERVAAIDTKPRRRVRAANEAAAAQEAELHDLDFDLGGMGDAFNETDDEMAPESLPENSLMMSTFSALPTPPATPDDSPASDFFARSPIAAKSPSSTALLFPPVQVSSRRPSLAPKAEEPPKPARSSTNKSPKRGLYIRTVATTPQIALGTSYALFLLYTLHSLHPAIFPSSPSAPSNRSLWAFVLATLTHLADGTAHEILSFFSTVHDKPDSHTTSLAPGVPALALLLLPYIFGTMLSTLSNVLTPSYDKLTLVCSAEMEEALAYQSWINEFGLPKEGCVARVVQESVPSIAKKDSRSSFLQNIKSAVMGRVQVVTATFESVDPFRGEYRVHNEAENEFYLGKMTPNEQTAEAGARRVRIPQCLSYTRSSDSERWSASSSTFWICCAFLGLSITPYTLVTFPFLIGAFSIPNHLISGLSPLLASRTMVDQLVQQFGGMNPTLRAFKVFYLLIGVATSVMGVSLPALIRREGKVWSGIEAAERENGRRWWRAGWTVGLGSLGWMMLVGGGVGVESVARGAGVLG